MDWQKIDGERVTIVENDGDVILLGEGHIKLAKFCRIARKVADGLGIDKEVEYQWYNIYYITDLYGVSKGTVMGLL